LIAFIFRFSSLASLLTALSCPLLCWWLVSMEAALWVAGMTVLVFARHHTNIQRLFAGSESKIGQKSA
ncbi:MAG TPA: glycerol-3-phosphate acyltransferase, partial [Alphaproteobacteria bacterium]|nr:glycerol-3-phosphate acyltransferase [Alphaproteobacteria bacterium]